MRPTTVCFAFHGSGCLWVLHHQAVEKSVKGHGPDVNTQILTDPRMNEV